MRALLSLFDDIGFDWASRYRCILLSLEQIILLTVIAFFSIVCTGAPPRPFQPASAARPPCAPPQGTPRRQ